MKNDIVREPINLNRINAPLTEKVYTQFSHQVRGALLDLYYGGYNIPLRLLGSTSQIDAFIKALSREKRYMDSYMKNGLNNHQTMTNRYELDAAVKKFELETGLKWPFKN